MSANDFENTGAPEQDYGATHRTSSSKSVDWGQILLIVLVVLATAASVVMLFTGNSGFLKLALLAALWAAIIGTFLVSRYRNQAEKTKLELEQQSVLYEAEISRVYSEMDISQAQMERDIEERLRANENETLAQIRSQLDELREQLEYITGQVFTAPELLQAQAQRIMELEAQTQGYHADEESDLTHIMQETPEPAVSVDVEPEPESDIDQPIEVEIEAEPVVQDAEIEDTFETTVIPVVGLQSNEEDDFFGSHEVHTQEVEDTPQPAKPKGKKAKKRAKREREEEQEQQRQEQAWAVPEQEVSEQAIPEQEESTETTGTFWTESLKEYGINEDWTASPMKGSYFESFLKSREEDRQVIIPPQQTSAQQEQQQSEQAPRTQEEAPQHEAPEGRRRHGRRRRDENDQAVSIEELLKRNK